MASPAQSTAPKHRPHGRAGCGWQWQWRLVVVARPTSPLASKAACLGEAVCAAVPCQQAGSAALQAKFGTTSDAYVHTDMCTMGNQTHQLLCQLLVQALQL